MSGIGHNGGPTMEPGYGFRKHAWGKARRALLPSLPLEVVRIRVARARRLGLPYQAYATIRATAGRDIVAFLFSGNALDLRGARVDLPAPVAGRLQALGGAAERLAAVHAPTDPVALMAAHPGLLEAALRAPGITATWRETREGGARRAGRAAAACGRGRAGGGDGAGAGLVRDRGAGRLRLAGPVLRRTSVTQGAA